MRLKQTKNKTSPCCSSTLLGGTELFVPGADAFLWPLQSYDSCQVFLFSPSQFLSTFLQYFLLSVLLAFSL